MNTKSTSISALISRIERAPNASRLIDAYDAAVGGSDVSMHRHRGTEWQVWHGEGSGFCGAFYEVRAHLAAEAEEILDREAAAQIASAPAMVPTPVQQQQACAAPAPAQKPWADKWSRISSRSYGDALLGVLATVESQFRNNPRTGGGLPVVRLEGDRHIMLGWAENEDAATACGRAWGYRFDLAVIVRDETGPVAYVLLGNGEADEVEAVDTLDVKICAFDGDGCEVDECDERAVLWRVGQGRQAWDFSGHNPACAFAQMCEGLGFVPLIVVGEPTIVDTGMVTTPVQQQQACAAQVPHPVGTPTHGWLDEEVRAYVDGVLRELMPVADAPSRQAVTDLEIAMSHAYAMSKAWIDLYERDCEDPLSVPFGDVFDARQRLQDAHARVDALTNAAAS